MELKVELKSCWSDKNGTYKVEEDFGDPTPCLKLQSMKEGEPILLSPSGVDDLISVLEMIKYRWRHQNSEK